MSSHTVHPDTKHSTMRANGPKRQHLFISLMNEPEYTKEQEQQRATMNQRAKKEMKARLSPQYPENFAANSLTVVHLHRLNPHDDIRIEEVRSSFERCINEADELDAEHIKHAGSGLSCMMFDDPLKSWGHAFFDKILQNCSRGDDPASTDQCQKLRTFPCKQLSLASAPGLKNLEFVHDSDYVAVTNEGKWVVYARHVSLRPTVNMKVCEFDAMEQALPWESCRDPLIVSPDHISAAGSDGDSGADHGPPEHMSAVPSTDMHKIVSQPTPEEEGKRGDIYFGAATYMLRKLSAHEGIPPELRVSALLKIPSLHELNVERGEFVVCLAGDFHLCSLLMLSGLTCFPTGMARLFQEVFDICEGLKEDFADLIDERRQQHHATDCTEDSSHSTYAETRVFMTCWSLQFIAETLPKC